MSVEESRVIDFITVSRDGTEGRLVISDHLPWSDPAHLKILKEKLNAYLDFAGSGEASDRFPEIQDLPLGIELRYLYDPTPEAISFLKKVRGVIESEGMHFHWLSTADAEKRAQQIGDGNAVKPLGDERSP